ncbi:MAG: NADPH-dependent oxidoreductase [SAR116 cluster bacterium]|nr:NADPH-dependent oxidoreductase [SAR116 cluster bacterium]
MHDLKKLLIERYGKFSSKNIKQKIPKNVGQIISRGSIRKFTKKKVSDEILESLIATAQSAPTKSNLQQYSILIVSDKKNKKKIAELLKETRWALEAPVFLLFLADIRRNQLITEYKGYEYKNNNMDHFMNAVIDSALSMQSLIIAAESWGLGICPISMVRNHLEEIKLICELPKGVFPIAGLSVGWPDEKKRVSPRLSKNLIFHKNKYSDEKIIEELKNYDELFFKKNPIPVSKQRHVDKYGPAEKGTWSENISRQLSIPERINFSNWLKNNGFDLK